MPNLRRLFLAKTNRFKLGIRHTQKAQSLANGFGTLLAQSKAVLAATSFVSMAFN